jgi:hypothetical protein
MVQYILSLAAEGMNRYSQNRASHGVMQAGLDAVAAGQGPLPAAQVQAAFRDYVNQPKVGIVSNPGVTTYNTRQSVPIPSVSGDTAFATLVRGNVSVTMRRVPMLHENNAVDLAGFSRQQYNEAVEQIKKAIDAAAYSALDAAKLEATLQTAPFPYELDAQNDWSVVVPAGITKSNEKQLEWIQALQYLSSYYTNEQIGAEPNIMLVSPTGLSILKETQKWGAYNEFNFAQFAEGLNYYASNSIPEGDEVDTIVRARALTLAPQSFGVYTWVSPDARRGVMAQDAEQMTVFIPELGFAVEMWVQRKHENLAADGGAAATYVETIMFTVDYSFVAAYNPDQATKPSPIMGWAFKDNVAAPVVSPIGE